MLPDANFKLDRQLISQFKISIGEISDHAVEVLLCDESDLSSLDFLRSRIGRSLIFHKVDRQFIERTEAQRPVESEGGHQSAAETDDRTSDSKAVRDVYHVISNAVSLGASDIHFEPGEHSLHCRARIDGVLQDTRSFAKSSAGEMLARIKILAGLDIAEKRRPQDGRIRFANNGRTVDIRVSVIPTALGEKAVLRLLDKRQLRLQLDQLGFTSNELSVFRSRISSPNGIVLVTGPTGSGKTTTLYAALQHLNQRSVNISTVEDPIEYEISGVNQTQVKPDIGVTFASLLRALLRQDPNIMMIGEIRDLETLEIAIRASLTGHLVLSTVHTNSAVATPTRLIDMGAQAYLLASTIRLIVAQRLLRRVCPHCSTPDLSDEQYTAAKALGIEIAETARVGAGCDACHGTGYRGRMAVAEFLDITEPLRSAIDSQQPETALRLQAEKDGFRPMIKSAERYINLGQTTPTEALRELQQ